jgi:branched-chain amino acid transport system substrate-binding protein
MFNPYVLVAAAIVAILGLGLYATPKANSGDITVGAILPLSGDMASIGTEMQRGMELALKDHPGSGIRIVYEDDQTLDNVASVNAAQKLILADHVDLILNDAVNTVKALTPILEENKVPAIVFWDSNVELKGMSPYVFTTGLSTEGAGSDMASVATDKLQAKTAYVISDQDEWSKIISDAFIKKFTEEGGTIAGHDTVSVDTIDFRTAIVKAKQAHASVLYFPLFPQQHVSLVRQAKELEFNGALLTGDGFTDDNLASLGHMANGLYVSLPWLENKSFLEKYRNAYGSDTNPANLSLAGLGYDAVEVAIDVVASLKAKGIAPTPQAIRDALPGFEFSGVTGAGKFSSDGIAAKTERIVTVVDGAYTPVQ